jgi:hypothetical protein
VALHEHSGVYGAWLQDGRLVTVEKARGPGGPARAGVGASLTPAAALALRLLS